MNATAAPRLSVAVDHAKHGRRVALCCPPDENGACRFPQCGKYDDNHQLVAHARKEVGKAPIGRFFPKGINDATTNTAKLDRLLREMPDANVSIELQSASWLVVDTDSAETEAAEQANGLDGAVIRESRNRAYVFERPADCPIINMTRVDGDALDILTFGNFLVHGTHRTGAPIRLDPNAKPGPAPARYVEMLKAKAAANAASAAAMDAQRAEWAAQYGDGPEPPVRLHQRGIRRWRGELVEAPSGELDRDRSLFFLGLDLAECGATRGAIVEALKERDIFHGWEKFTHRKDDREYVKIAEKVVASATEKEKAPRIQFTAADAGVAERSATPGAIPPDPGEPSSYEDALAELKRLRRLLLNRDDLIDDQKAVITAQRADLEDKTAYISLVTEVLARPNEEMSSSEKIVFLVLTWETHYRAARGRSNLPLIALEERSGLSKNVVSKLSRSICARDGSPFERTKTREWRVFEDGSGQWVTTIEVSPKTERVEETMRSGIVLPKAPDKPKHGGSQAAADARWGHCEKHANDLVRIKGYCPECGKVVGETAVTLAEFDALNHQLGDSEASPTHGVGVVPSSNQLGDSDTAPRSLLDYAAARPPDPPPKRCPAPGCRAMEFRQAPDGSWRCLKSAHDPRSYELVPMVAGGEE